MGCDQGAKANMTKSRREFFQTKIFACILFKCIMVKIFVSNHQPVLTRQNIIIRLSFRIRVFVELKFLYST